MIRVKFEPRDEGKMVIGRVEVDGVDISRRVKSLSFDARAGDAEMTLHLIIRPEDDIDLAVSEDDLTVNATVVRPGGAVDVTAVSDEMRRRVLVPHVDTESSVVDAGARLDYLLSTVGE